jgi:hypothetical protein
MENLLRPALLTATITCLSISLVNLVKSFSPSWGSPFFLVGLILVTLEAIYSYQNLKKRGRIKDNKFRYRLAEWCTIVILLKILTYANKPWEITLADIKSCAAEPLNIIDMEFSVFVFLAFLVWSATTNIMKTFGDLFDHYRLKSRAIDPFTSLTNRFYCGGVLIVFISGAAYWISSSGLGALTDFDRTYVSAVFFNVMIYFILGLILLSQTQLNIHLTGWKFQKVEVSDNVVKNWAGYGMIVLFAVGAVVYFLPTSYTTGFLSSVKLVLQYGLKVFLILSHLIWAIILIPLKWFLALFPLENRAYQKTPEDRHMLSGEIDISAPDSDVIYSFIFWLVILSIVLYLLKIYFKDHPELLQWIRKVRVRYSWIEWIAKLWKWLKRGAHEFIEMIPRPVILYTKETDKKVVLKQRRFRLGKMTARQRIIYYYLQTLKSAEKAGFKRRNSQTPAELAPQLAEIIPDMNEEIDVLTAIFVRARYSRDNYRDNEVFIIKRIWKYVRSELRRSKRKNEN